MSALEAESKTLASYADELADFDAAKDFVLQGVWDALAYAPTYLLADGSRLRPLSSAVLLRLREDDGKQLFDLVSYREVSSQVVTGHAVEMTWTTN